MNIPFYSFFWGMVCCFFVDCGSISKLFNPARGTEDDGVHARLVSNPSFDPFLVFSILFSKFLFQNDLFSPDEDEPEYNVDHN